MPSLGLLSRGMRAGVRAARKYLGPDEEQKKKQAGQTGPAAGPAPVDVAQPTPNQANRSAMTFQRPRRSIFQGVKDRALERGATEDDPNNPGKRRKKGFGLGMVAKGMLGGM